MGLRPSYLSWTLRLAVLAVSTALVACGGGGGGGSLTSSGNTQNGTMKEPATGPVAISGVVTFDRVNHKSNSPGLDYQNVQQAPARGVKVLLLNSKGETLDSVITDEGGAYRLDAPAETDVRVRVQARMERTGTPSWTFSVRDNTEANALYVLDGQLVGSGATDSIRDLHAPSGWNGSDYAAGGRSAAPFAILDTVREAVDQVVAVDPDVQLPEMNVFWSSDNIATEGDLSDGDIGTSFYTSSGPSIYLLGYASNDTDEYDRSVISHEFAHYLEDQLSRTESIGGFHSDKSRLDMRVAFSEGLGNAFAGIATEDSVYRDSNGSGQAVGTSYDVATNDSGNHGWYSESSVQTILFSLYTQSGGFGSIYRTLTGSHFLDFDGASSIYTFVTALRASAEVDEQFVDGLLTAEGITGTDGYGANETNDGGSLISLPLYRNLSLDQTVDVCSDRRAGDYNGLDVRRFIRFTILNSGMYKVDVQPQTGFMAGDPDLVLWRAGERVESSNSESPDGRELLTDLELSAGDYWLEVYDYYNVDDDINSGGLSCFTVSLGNAP